MWAIISAYRRGATWVLLVSLSLAYVASFVYFRAESRNIVIAAKTSCLPAIPFPSEIVFTEEHSILLVEGFSHPEDWGCWIEGSSSLAHVRFAESPVDPFIIRFNVAMAMVGDTYPVRAFTVCVDGGQPESYVVQDGDAFPLIFDYRCEPSWIGRDNELAIHLDVSESIRPIDVMNSTDSRPLGIGLRSIEFIPEE